MRASRFSWCQQERLIEPFVSGSAARSAAELVGVNRKTSADYFQRLQVIISNHLEKEASEFLSGEIEVDASYLGGAGSGNRGRGAGGKKPVFSLLKRVGRVYTKMIPDTKSETLMPITQQKAIPQGIVYNDCWRGDNILDVSEFKHDRMNHSKLFAKKDDHINALRP